MFEKRLYITVPLIFVLFDFFHDRDRNNVHLHVPLFDESTGVLLFLVIIQKGPGRKIYFLFDWLKFGFVTDNIDTLYGQRIKERFCHTH